LIHLLQARYPTAPSLQQVAAVPERYSQPKLIPAFQSQNGSVPDSLAVDALDLYGLRTCSANGGHELSVFNNKGSASDSSAARGKQQHCAAHRRLCTSEPATIEPWLTCCRNSARSNEENTRSSSRSQIASAPAESVCRTGATLRISSSSPTPSITLPSVSLT
jgi:hypothetical protein